MRPRASTAVAALLLVALTVGCTSSGGGSSAGGGTAKGADGADVTVAPTGGRFPVCPWAAAALDRAGLPKVDGTTDVTGPQSRLPKAWVCRLTLTGGAVVEASAQGFADVAAARAALAGRRAVVAGADGLAAVDAGDEAFTFTGFGVTGVTARARAVVLDVAVVRRTTGGSLDAQKVIAVAVRLARTVGAVPPVPVPTPAGSVAPS